MSNIYEQFLNIYIYYQSMFIANLQIQQTDSKFIMPICPPTKVAHTNLHPTQEIVGL